MAIMEIASKGIRMEVDVFIDSGYSALRQKYKKIECTRRVSEHQNKNIYTYASQTTT